MHFTTTGKKTYSYSKNVKYSMNSLRGTPGKVIEGRFCECGVVASETHSKFLFALGLNAQRVGNCLTRFVFVVTHKDADCLQHSQRISPPSSSFQTKSHEFTAWRSPRRYHRTMLNPEVSGSPV